ncbi:MAG: CRISPR-associated endonuclease Cas1 [Elusimicrobia bacterium]|nr:CRISPR-associated endonuclease Cas1 [Elusimicrobiota bacterium]
MENGAALTFLSEGGRSIARVDAPQSGNVLLRREQFRRADKDADCARIVRPIVAGKIQNARNLIFGPWGPNREVGLMLTMSGQGISR